MRIYSDASFSNFCENFLYLNGKVYRQIEKTSEFKMDCDITSKKKMHCVAIVAKVVALVIVFPLTVIALVWRFISRMKGQEVEQQVVDRRNLFVSEDNERVTEKAVSEGNERVTEKAVSEGNEINSILKDEVQNTSIQKELRKQLALQKTPEILNNILKKFPLSQYPQLEIIDPKRIIIQKDKSVEKINYLFVDASTMESILDNTTPDSEVIAIDYANEYHGGGGPGMGLLFGRIVKYFWRCRAQEEEMCISTDLLLRIHKHTIGLPFISMMRILKGKARGFSKNRTCMAGKVFAFASQKNVRKDPKYHHEIVPYYHISSAAPCVRYNLKKSRQFAKIREQNIKELLNNVFFNDIRNRIKDHLTVAANKEIGKGKKKILITGAFGCGAFAPRHNMQIDEKYVKAVAEIYGDLLEGEFKGCFPLVIMTVPNFGTPDKPDICYKIFEKKFNKKI